MTSHSLSQTGFGLTVNAREDGTLEAAYLQISNNKVVRTEELVESVLLLDYDQNDHIAGIEILAPVKISQVMEIADRLELSHQDSFRNFVRSSAPPALLTE
jgi:uncharacterized protein YuzE